MDLLSILVCTYLIGAPKWEPEICKTVSLRPVKEYVRTNKEIDAIVLAFCREEARESEKIRRRIAVCKLTGSKT